MFGAVHDGTGSWLGTVRDGTVRWLGAVRNGTWQQAHRHSATGRQAGIRQAGQALQQPPPRSQAGGAWIPTQFIGAASCQQRLRHTYQYVGRGRLAQAHRTRKDTAKGGGIRIQFSKLFPSALGILYIKGHRYKIFVLQLMGFSITL